MIQALMCADWSLQDLQAILGVISSGAVSCASQSVLNEYVCG